MTDTTPTPEATDVLPDPRIAPYLTAARRSLSDLPPGEQAELLDDLHAHLHEILADESEAFEARLGAPDEYAAEFRASAGYPPVGGPLGAGGQPSRTRRWGRRLHDHWTTTTDAAGMRLRAAPGGPALLGLLPRLRPAWWVFRAWLVAVALGVDWPTGHYSGMSWWGALAWLLVLVVASVAWGLRAERRPHQGPGQRRALERIGLGALNAFAVACCALAVLGAGPIAQQTEIAYVADERVADPAPVNQTGVWLNGSPVTNFVAYDLTGKPIEGFQLFDQDGAPVTVDENAIDGPEQGWAYPVPVSTSNGTEVTNVYPIRRVDVTDPDEYYCDATNGGGVCDPYAMGTVQAQRPAPVGSPWKDLTVLPVPAVGSTLPFDESWKPVWSGIQPPTPPAGSPTPSPSPSEAPSAEKKADAKPSQGSDQD